MFGNAGGGKSTLARRLSQITGLPLYPLDLIQFRRGGGKLPHDEYLREHAALIEREEWIIDGFGCAPSSRQRFAAADTLVYIDLPLLTHYWWVTKRFAKGLFVNPEGWPENSPIWSSTLDSYRVVRLYRRGLTPGYRQLVAAAASSKQVHHLRSAAQMRSFLQGVKSRPSPGSSVDRAAPS